MSRPRSMSLSKGTLHRRLNRARTLTYHVVVAGAAGVGKSTLVARLLSQPPAPVYLPTTENLYVKTLELDSGDRCHAQIYDTAGHPKVMEVFCKGYREKGDVFVLLYSATDAGSLEALGTIIHTLQLPCPADPHTAGRHVVLVATKQDLLASPWARSCTANGEALASRLGCSHVTLSAKDCLEEEVLALFQRTVSVCHQGAGSTTPSTIPRLSNSSETLGAAYRRSSSTSAETNESRPAARSHSLSDIGLSSTAWRQLQKNNSLNSLSGLLSFCDHSLGYGQVPVIEDSEPPTLEGCFLTLDLAGDPVERQEPSVTSAQEDLSLCAVSSTVSCGVEVAHCRQSCECSAEFSESLSMSAPLRTSRHRPSISQVLRLGGPGHGSRGTDGDRDRKEEPEGDTCVGGAPVPLPDTTASTKHSRRFSLLQTLTRRRRNPASTDAQSRPSQDSLTGAMQHHGGDKEQGQEQPLAISTIADADKGEVCVSTSSEGLRATLFGRRNSESTVCFQSPRVHVHAHKANAAERQPVATVELHTPDRPDTQQTKQTTASTLLADGPETDGFRTRLTTMLASPSTRRKTSRTESGSVPQAEAPNAQLLGEGTPSASPRIARPSPRLSLARPRLLTLGKYLHNLTGTVYAPARDDLQI